MRDIDISGISFEKIVTNDRNVFEVQIKYYNVDTYNTISHFFNETKKKEMLLLILMLSTYENYSKVNYFRMSDKLRELCNVNSDSYIDSLIKDVLNIKIEDCKNDKDIFISKFEEYFQYLYVPIDIFNDNAFVDILDYKIFYYDNKSNRQELKIKSVDKSFFL